MKTLLTLIVLILMNLLFQEAQAQISIVHDSDQIEILKKQKKEVVAEEKAKLAEDILAINNQLKDGEITKEAAENKKKKAAELRALNIEDKLDIIDTKIALLQRNHSDKKEVKVMIGYTIFSGKEEVAAETDSVVSRTVSSPYIAFGLNNAIFENDGLNHSPYKIGGSRFFEIGYEFTTSFSEVIRVKYGVAFQFNGLKPDDNLYFVQDGEQTYLTKYPKNLSKSKLRNDNLVLPVHVEFGQSKIVRGNQKTYHSTENEFKFGLGGYFGLNINTVQKLKYKVDGHREKSKLKKSYNTTNFIYGLSAYIGYDYYSLYLKYDLNPIFTDNPIAEHNVSMGVRLAF